MTDNKPGIKRIDIHCHVVGNGQDINKVDDDVYFNFKDNRRLFTRMVESLVRHSLKDLGGDIVDGLIQARSYFEILQRCDRWSFKFIDISPIAMYSDALS
jgi:uncharacterized protein YaiL (DUF2058 family)